jgi:hypothetical protein
MSSPGNKPDPSLMKSFEGANQRPAPKTREEAGQLAIDMRHDELDRIACFGSVAIGLTPQRKIERRRSSPRAAIPGDFFCA